MLDHFFISGKTLIIYYLQTTVVVILQIHTQCLYKLSSDWSVLFIGMCAVSQTSMSAGWADVLVVAEWLFAVRAYNVFLLSHWN